VLSSPLHNHFFHRLSDAQSPRGIYKSLMHRLRQYPDFIIEEKDVYIGWDRGRIEEVVDKYVRVASSQIVSFYS
jgi:hypothetical protein